MGINFDVHGFRSADTAYKKSLALICFASFCDKLKIGEWQRRNIKL